MQNLLDKINSHPRATLLATGSGIFIVATVVIIAMISSLQNNLVSPAITPEEEKMVLSEVIRNNPKGLINNSQAPVNTSNPIPTGNQIPVETPTQPGIGNPNPEAPQPEPPVAPNLNEYNYRKTTVTYEKGIAYESCKTFQHGSSGQQYPYGSLDSEGVTTSEYTEYFERYYTAAKSQIKDGDNLFSFAINKYGRDINQSTYYLEGNYAVENSYIPYSQYDNQSDTQVVSYPAGTTEDLIRYYFGNNASITGFETDSNGVKHYTIQSSYSSFCDQSYDAWLVSDRPVPPQRTLITAYKINGNTFAIEQTKRYVDQVNDLNLLDISTTTNVRSKVTAQQIASQFEIAANVTIQKNDYSNLNQVYDNVKEFKDKIDFLADQEADLLLPDELNGLSYIYASGFTAEGYIDTLAFYKDRLFYPQSLWGDTLFEKYNQSYTNEELEYTLSFNQTQYNYYSVTSYKNTTLDEKLEESLSVNVTSINVEDVNLTITGNLVPVKKITKVFTYNYPTSYSVSYPVSYTNPNTSYFVSYMFEIDGKVYDINYYNHQNQMNFDTKLFTIWNLDNQVSIDNAKSKVLELYNLYTHLWSPVSYPVSYSN